MWTRATAWRSCQRNWITLPIMGSSCLPHRHHMAETCLCTDKITLIHAEICGAPGKKNESLKETEGVWFLLEQKYCTSLLNPVMTCRPESKHYGDIYAEKLLIFRTGFNWLLFMINELSEKIEKNCSVFFFMTDLRISAYFSQSIEVINRDAHIKHIFLFLLIKLYIYSILRQKSIP